MVCCSLLLTACRIGVPAAEAITVTITSPANYATVALGQPAQIVVSATAGAGVSRIEMTIDGALVAVANNTDLTTSYQTTIYYTPLIQGPLNLVVRAYDKNNTVSAPVGLTLQSVMATRPALNTGTEAPGAKTATPTSAISATPIPGIAGPNGCDLNMQFIADVSVSDGTVIPFNGAFTKTWRVRNTGTCAWDSAYKLVFASGAQMGAPGSVSMNPVKPNEVTDISVPMKAPGSGSGPLSGEWRLAAPDNTIFGNKLTVVIALPAATTTPQPTTMPATATVNPTIEFKAGSTSVTKGSCTTLSWSTNNVAGVFFNDTGVTSPSSTDVCPTDTTTYTLKVNFNDGSSTVRQIVIAVTSGAIVYSFADNAPSAHWYNDLSEVLPYGGPDTDNRGFAMSRDGVALEDGSLQLKVIETHPRWVTGGNISGDFAVSNTLQSGDRFRTRIGFIQGATGRSVTVRVLFKGVIIGEVSKVYDGSLSNWDIDLSSFTGQTGTFTLQAVAIPSATQAWICWINPHIER
ncbi:MAG: NBR1-Ig-like domain-containing protein [Chloroflexi bacterium]|nr:NBR1-Ig-like domain-containing protein [Chloroflexota bacterium]